ncbi:MAG: metallophosphoesterase, partial [Planctomycetales bacterium]|nr:metallophosphoesterase [Planctomycetales bacterium]
MSCDMSCYRLHFLACLALSYVCCLSSLPRAGAAPHDGEDHHHPHAAASKATIGQGLVLPDIQGPKPWSDKPALTDANRFSIAIMTDRTGGHRPGIWMQGVQRLNWLRPDFVVSVGDLIEGYTEDDAEIARQWKEFLGFIEQLEMKFFFVAGNHDVTNPKLHKIWRQQFGREWYSFNYKDVHFVCLSSEDPTAHLGEEQLQWLEQDLGEHRQARWTLLFLHKPLWVTAERDAAAGNPDSTNWTRVVELLGGRPHTVFAGHVHHYVQYQRDGQHYYSLATTGGSSQLRGTQYGEFDHVTWLTMEADGPHVANLLLDGIQPADVVTEEGIGRFHTFLQQVRLEVAPILISGSQLQSGDIRIRLQNEFDSDVQIQATIDGLPLMGLSMESHTLELAARSGESIEQVVGFEMQQPVELTRFAGTTLTAQIQSADDPPLRAEWSVPVIIDREYQIRPQAVALDGLLGEWSGQWQDS